MHMIANFGNENGAFLWGLPAKIVEQRHVHSRTRRWSSKHTDLSACAISTYVARILVVRYRSNRTNRTIKISANISCFTVFLVYKLRLLCTTWTVTPLYFDNRWEFINVMMWCITGQGMWSLSMAGCVTTSVNSWTVQPHGRKVLGYSLAWI